MCTSFALFVHGSPLLPSEQVMERQLYPLPFQWYELVVAEDLFDAEGPFGVPSDLDDISTAKRFKYQLKLLSAKKIEKVITSH